MYKILCLIPALFLLLFCASKSTERRQDAFVTQKNGEALHTLAARFPAPSGFERIAADSASFGAWLRRLPLKPDSAAVHLYNGQLKYDQSVHAAVIEMDVGSEDLQQCADACMRLWAEYLFAQKRYGDLHFNLTNGFRVDYEKWQAGYRVLVVGNSTTWVKRYRDSNTYADFRDYLTFVFRYAGTLSLSRELPEIALSDLQIGDIFIKGGSPGHAVMVLDCVKNVKTGKKMMHLGQSYMPAQEFHVLKNLHGGREGVWFDLPESGVLTTPEWNFNPAILRRFGQ
jgi:hypothetical protein